MFVARGSWGIVAVGLLLTIVSTATAKYSGGSGTARDPYQIATAADLIALGETPADYHKHFVLTADIDLDPNLPGRKVFDKAVIAGQTPSWEGPTPFLGAFDGNGHTISHLTIIGGGYLGLFGQIGSWPAPVGEVKDLALVDVQITASDGGVGGLVGSNFGSISMSCSSGSVSGTGSFVGGLVGWNHGSITASCSSGTVKGNDGVGGLVGLDHHGNIATSYSSGAVKGNNEVGGLVGRSWYASITTSYSTGAVSGENGVGGLVGSQDGGSVTQCYSTGTVSGGWAVGGLVGGNYSGVMTQCYSTGAVRGNDNVGGLVGCNGGDDGPSIVTDCFWDIQTSGQTASAGGTGKTTAEMQTARTFLEAGWDLVDETANGTDDIWWIFEGKEYPRLVRESTPPCALCPNPPNGATDVIQAPILSWQGAPGAAGHDVYFGEDETAVANATPASQGIYHGRHAGDVTTYDPGTLEWCKTYYWRVDEVNEVDPNSPWKGSLWSFTTADFILVLVIDDFESYTDDFNAGTAILQTWTPVAGAWVGSLQPPWAEQTIVHASRQSMPMDYQNTYEPWYSEAERTWETPQDWTIADADTLTLYFRGEPNNSPEPLYVGIEDSAGQIAVVVHPDPNAVLVTEWQKWHIALADVRAAGVDVAAVQKMVIGVGDRQNPKPGGMGRIYIDDIRMTKRMP